VAENTKYSLSFRHLYLKGTPLQTFVVGKNEARSKPASLDLKSGNFTPLYHNPKQPVA
jgi:hypothetical protein